ncbi:hypothetical protein GSI_09267 [Ganoderma sinense ZZ0214-1]|uniref:Uncharacterized protein n=1 Tax=Ganoderma sinense ZZ0214-1 TaxID=1077348 RepID=A0A2G8S6P8_9APHY|nr:hypothetical protein GSI_09267 [Ganoderma sinense ZZ0214-1]
MRLLDTKTGQFVNHDPRTDIYAILSHTWVPEGEQTYQELQAIQRDYDSNGFSRLAYPPQVVSARLAPTTTSTQRPAATNYKIPQPASIWDDPKLSPKIRLACETAREAGFRYLWIDSCCIDKMNSAEWSEAINSMYAWYRDAKICFAFLSDVPTSPPSRDSRFRTSRWFTRGWTLQELLAPREVVFLSTEWKYLGTRDDLAPLLQTITGIDRGVLRQEVSLDAVSVAKRMSWASTRETTRLEDEAYSLLGIFDLHMSTMYGEGRRAFRRLQEEILKRIPDQSLFAWGNPGIGPVPATFLPCVADLLESTPAEAIGQAAASTSGRGAPFLSSVGRPMFVDARSMFATSPRDFYASGSIAPFVDHDSFAALLGGIDIPVQDYSPSPYGTRTQLPLLSLSNKLGFSPEDYDFCIAILACTDQRYGDSRLLGRLCVVQRYQSPSSKLHRLYATGLLQANLNGLCSLFVLPHAQVLKQQDLLRHINVQTVYLPNPDRELPPHKDEDFPYGPVRDLGDEGITKVTVQFPQWAVDRLRAQGYVVNVSPRTHDTKTGALIALSKGPNTLHIIYQYSVSKLHRVGVIDFIARIYRIQPESVPHASLSRNSRHAGLARTMATLYTSVTLRVRYGQRSANDITSVSFLDGSTVVVRVDLELVSAACYHLKFSVESENSSSEDEATVEADDSVDPRSDEGRFVLRTGVIRMGSPD